MITDFSVCCLDLLSDSMFMLFLVFVCDSRILNLIDEDVDLII